jgi:hypothetical protein
VRLWSGFLVICLLITGCSSGQKIRDLTRPLPELQKVARESVPVGLAKTSPNGREFESVPFRQDREDGFVLHEGSGEGRIVRIQVLGDRRPYTIAVQALVVSRDPGGQLVQRGTDEGLARVVIRRIQQVLHQRREDRNVIDDFKVF